MLPERCVALQEGSSEDLAGWREGSVWGVHDLISVSVSLSSLQYSLGAAHEVLNCLGTRQ